MLLCHVCSSSDYNNNHNNNYNDNTAKATDRKELGLHKTLQTLRYSDCHKMKESLDIERQ